MPTYLRKAKVIDLLSSDPVKKDKIPFCLIKIEKETSMRSMVFKINYHKYNKKQSACIFLKVFCHIIFINDKDKI